MPLVMPMLDDFYFVEQSEISESAWQGVVSFNEHHEIFKGHFPDQPVVPGVCLLQMVREVVEDILKRPYFIVGSSQVKFLQLITPEMRPELTLQWKEETPLCLVHAVYKLDKPLNKISLELQRK